MILFSFTFTIFVVSQNDTILLIYTVKNKFFESVRINTEINVHNLDVFYC